MKTNPKKKYITKLTKNWKFHRTKKNEKLGNWDLAKRYRFGRYPLHKEYQWVQEWFQRDEQDCRFLGSLWFLMPPCLCYILVAPFALFQSLSSSTKKSISLSLSASLSFFLAFSLALAILIHTHTQSNTETHTESQFFNFFWNNKKLKKIKTFFFFGCYNLSLTVMLLLLDFGERERERERVGVKEFRFQ